MLTHLSISNYTLVEQLDLDLQRGMTAITGETGAGKSIMLDALGLALGDRADADRVRVGATQAEIHAWFDLEKHQEARQWLLDNDLPDNECLLRRIVTAEGRSRAYINGMPATLGQIRELGEMLIDIHAQHEHQSLLHKETQRRLVDEYARHRPLADQVMQAYRDWQRTLERYNTLKDNAEEVSARLQLLSYQVEELDQLDLQPGELDTLEAEQKQLANGETILQSCYQVVAMCGGEDQSLLESVSRGLQVLNQLPDDIAALSNIRELLSNAQIQIEEAQHELEHYIDSFDMDPERLQSVEERLTTVYDIARKHRIQPNQLQELHENLQTELQSLGGAGADLDHLFQLAAQQEGDYRRLAEQLSQQRQKAADKLAKAINQQLKKLAMEHAKLKVELTPLEVPTLHGLEDIQLVISTNPGQPMKPIGKIASGGELSRISLAIQVVTAQTSATPTLVFDEVDVGIGGATADVVGQLLRQLGEKGQVICVTHLAQVAGKGHQHLRVNKLKKGSKIATDLVLLNEAERIEEIARMLGNAEITDASLQHAKEMIG